MKKQSKPNWIKEGDVVDYRSIIGHEVTQPRMRVSHGPTMVSGNWVVWLEGKSGCVAVEACTPATEEGLLQGLKSMQEASIRLAQNVREDAQALHNSVSRSLREYPDLQKTRILYTGLLDAVKDFLSEIEKPEIQETISGEIDRAWRLKAIRRGSPEMLQKFDEEQAKSIKDQMEIGDK